MITVELPPLQPYQKDVLDFYSESPKGNWCVIKSPRQVGKSTLLECLLIAASLRTEKSHSISISPISSQARKLFADINNMANSIIKKANGALLEITFINESTISFYSAESGDNLRGDTVRKDGILCVDEASYIKEDFFYSVAVPFTNVSGADIFIFSTPKFKAGLFYDLYTKGIDKVEDIHSFDWTNYDLSKFLSEQILDIYRKRLPKNAFRSEYLAEFIDGDGAVFSDFKRCIGEYNLDTTKEVWMTIDWGTGQGSDFTVFTIGQYNDKLNKIGISKQIYFNDLGTNDTIGQILYQVKQLVKTGVKELTIMVEKNSIGNVFFSTMKDQIDEFIEKYNDEVSWKDEINIRQGTFTTTNSSKEDIIKKLIVLFEQNQIIIPKDDKLLNELSMYECTINSKGTPIYNAPNGFHDDCVMSLCILAGNLYNKVKV